jgi:hypothetical protein
MHINPTEYRGFIKSYDCPTNKLTTIINIIPIASIDKNLRNMAIEVKALWDTGATLSFIKPELRDNFKLSMVRTGSSATIAGVGGQVKADFTIVSLLLAQNFVLEYCPVYVVDFPVNFDMVIGMDIINMGDFAVSNTENKTSFSFVVPPLPDRINFAEKAKMLNIQKIGK